MDDNCIFNCNTIPWHFRSPFPPSFMRPFEATLISPCKKNCNHSQAPAVLLALGWTREVGSLKLSIGISLISWNLLEIALMAAFLFLKLDHGQWVQLISCPFWNTIQHFLVGEIVMKLLLGACFFAIATAFLAWRPSPRWLMVLSIVWECRSRRSFWNLCRGPRGWKHDVVDN